MGTRTAARHARESGHPGFFSGFPLEARGNDDLGLWALYSVALYLACIDSHEPSRNHTNRKENGEYEENSRFWWCLLGYPGLCRSTDGSRAGAQAKPIEGVKFEVSQSLNDNLKPFLGKLIYVNLRSGKTFFGSLKAVGDHWIHLEKLAERNFFDALIRIEDISAIEVQFRDNK